MRQDPPRRSPSLLHGLEKMILYWLARTWRPFLRRTTFVGITGSLGKTTCKECLTAILKRSFPTQGTKNNQNDLNGVPRTLLRIRPWYRFGVVEMGTGVPGLVERSARLVRPGIGVFLCVARTHTDRLPTPESRAEEKAALLRVLPADGVAVLNADDPLVAGSADQCRGRVLRFGTGQDVDLRLIEASSRWPDRLVLRVEAEGRRFTVRTRLVGEQWAASVLGALLAARACGVGYGSALPALEELEPFMGRMQPVPHPSGAVILRDENSSSPDSLFQALRVLREARVERRVLVISGVADSVLNTRLRFRELGEQAAESCDAVVFIDKYGHYGMKASVARGMDPSLALWFKDLHTASEQLKGMLRPGDLVLVRGRGTDHLTRLVFHQFGPVGCWKKCPKTSLCDVCPELKPAHPLSLRDRP